MTHSPVLLFKISNKSKNLAKISKMNVLNYFTCFQTFHGWKWSLEGRHHSHSIVGDFILLGLRILTGKKHRQMQLQCLQKVRIQTFGSLVHQINSLQEVLKLKQNFQNFFVIGPFCTPHSTCLDIGFWYGSFILKRCIFNLSSFN